MLVEVYSLLVRGVFASSMKCLPKEGMHLLPSNTPFAEIDGRNLLQQEVGTHLWASKGWTVPFS